MLGFKAIEGGGVVQQHTICPIGHGEYLGGGAFGRHYGRNLLTIRVKAYGFGQS